MREVQDLLEREFTTSATRVDPGQPPHTRQAGICRNILPSANFLYKEGPSHGTINSS